MPAAGNPAGVRLSVRFGHACGEPAGQPWMQEAVQRFCSSPALLVPSIPLCYSVLILIPS
jgi:hypothetical protein